METDKNKNNENTEHRATESEATDFLGTQHGNKMPDKETDPKKTLNPEQNGDLKSRTNQSANDNKSPD